MGERGSRRSVRLCRSYQRPFGGDADTQACIAGGIAQAFYRKIPDFIVQEARLRLDPLLLSILDEFNPKYNVAF